MSAVSGQHSQKITSSYLSSSVATSKFPALKCSSHPAIHRAEPIAPLALSDGRYLEIACRSFASRPPRVPTLTDRASASRVTHDLQKYNSSLEARSRAADVRRNARHRGEGITRGVCMGRPTSVRDGYCGIWPRRESA